VNEIALLFPEPENRIDDPPCPLHLVEADEVGGVAADDVRQQRLVRIRLRS